MAIYQVSETTCIVVNPKAGSASMYNAISVVSPVELTLSEALRKREDITDPLTDLVVFIVDPIKRLNSLFNMFYWLTVGHGDYDEFMPAGTITADGRRVAGFLGRNEHHFTGDKVTRYQNRIAAKRGEATISDEELAIWLDNSDWRALVDFVLKKDSRGKYENNNPHWGNQVDLCTHEGIFLPTIAYRFDNSVDIARDWARHVGGTFPHLNSWQSVPHNDYKLDELKDFYAPDLNFRRGLDDWRSS